MEADKPPYAYEDEGKCQWKQRSAINIRNIDNPTFCNFIADKDTGFCQKHGIINVILLLNGYKS